jgi:hypothetical protein
MNKKFEHFFFNLSIFYLYKNIIFKKNYKVNFVLLWVIKADKSQESIFIQKILIINNNNNIFSSISNYYFIYAN